MISSIQLYILYPNTFLCKIIYGVLNCLKCVLYLINDRDSPGNFKKKNFNFYIYSYDLYRKRKPLTGLFVHSFFPIET